MCGSSDICMQTDRQTGTLITILGSPTGGKSSNKTILDSRLDTLCATHHYYFLVLVAKFGQGQSILLSSRHLGMHNAPQNPSSNYESLCINHFLISIFHAASVFAIILAVSVCEKNDIIHKNRTTSHITMLPEEDRAMFSHVLYKICEHTDSHAQHNTSLLGQRTYITVTLCYLNCANVLLSAYVTIFSLI